METWEVLHSTSDIQAIKVHGVNQNYSQQNNLKDAVTQMR